LASGPAQLTGSYLEPLMSTHHVVRQSRQPPDHKRPGGRAVHVKKDHWWQHDLYEIEGWLAARERINEKTSNPIRTLSESTCREG